MRICAMLLGLTLVPVAVADEGIRHAVGVSTAVGCHHLLTETECGAFLDQLSLAGEHDRDRILARYAALLKDRERACACRSPVAARSTFSM